MRARTPFSQRIYFGNQKFLVCFLFAIVVAGVASAATSAVACYYCVNAVRWFSFSPHWVIVVTFWILKFIFRNSGMAPAQFK